VRRAIPRESRQIPRGHAQFTRDYRYSTIEMLGKGINTVFTGQGIR